MAYTEIKNGMRLKDIVKLIIIFIIFLIIFVQIYKYTSNVNNYQNYVHNMQLIQTKVNEIRDDYTKSEKYNPNESGNFYNYLRELGFQNANSPNYNKYIDEFTEILNDFENDKDLKYWDKNVDQIITNYYYFSPIDLKNNFGLKDFNDHVIINFYTGNVVSKNGVKTHDGNIIHRQYDSKEFGKPLELNNIFLSDIETNFMVENNFGFSQNVRITILSDKNYVSNIYYYTDKDDSLRNCTGFNNFNYDKINNVITFEITKSDKYHFIIKDYNNIDYKVIDKEFCLNNPPKLLDGMEPIYWDEENNEVKIENKSDPNWYDYSSENKKLANSKTSDGNYWVWIPSFVYSESDDDIDIKFVNGQTNTCFDLTAVKNYVLDKSFENVDGFWIAKFQSIDDKNLKIIPGKTLKTINKKDAIKICTNYRKESKLLSSYQKEIFIKLGSFYGIDIANDLVHYSGGSPNEKEYINNTRYSSSGNVYGVYDLLSSEYELLLDENQNNYGRFRSVLY